MTAQEYADMVVSGNAPWLAKGENWSDSTKEQYFNFLNAEQANQMEVERWRLNNEYNSPVEQMKRMIAAGINPAAAYQNISSGNSSNAPDTHQPGTAAFHDTQDKLARINTIMNGISSVMSTIEHGVGAVAGIQDIQFGYQNNWLDKFRSYTWNQMGIPTIYSQSDIDGLKSKGYDTSSLVEIYPGLYTGSNSLQIFPELFQGFDFSSGKYHQGESNIDIQTDLKDRRVRIDQLIQRIMHGLETNEDESQMIKYFFELFMYGAMSKFGGF